jgi:hypothetical protein
MASRKGIKAFGFGGFFLKEGHKFWPFLLIAGDRKSKSYFTFTADFK